MIGRVCGLIVLVAASMQPPAGLRAAEPVPEPVIPDCLEGAGDDLKSVDWDKLVFPPAQPPPEPPTS